MRNAAAFIGVRVSIKYSSGSLGAAVIPDGGKHGALLRVAECSGAHATGAFAWELFEQLPLLFTLGPGYFATQNSGMTFLTTHHIYGQSQGLSELLI